ncbi:hypothetical protein TVAG_410150 [Trichomonas vaginalis G3]|uniref:E2F/DP family winged-helix DNA-binding domain-containing protein n=1 Tax=Trichomonas vaginalis (strain ATCC PRA-98 / G3) TaxID=412133 RepID=A2E8I1_TRIV3|nr:transcription factor, enhancer of yellow 2 family [Trichomonas vaginalis G3]EAY11018.1 hypothetical protein TVAG_410150 [Trichomonas vaginalis G3]KAI5531808.1 transcription factor, enhancer of yellow 2 family [Trichomonas vaginalis G3]|eukprot:XP_001323241.1 hypothetical protein [Trichomonas vaginalis G3]
MSRDAFEKYRGERRHDSFANSTLKLIHRCASDKNMIFNLSKLSSRLGFHQRRFYDVINVLNTIGYCTKLDSSRLQWNGVSNVKDAISKLIMNYHLLDKHSSIESILPSDGTVSISRITESFLMLFIYLGSQSLNIKETSMLLAMHSGRSKTTLCKLYQIAQILEVAGVLSRTAQISEIKMNDPFFIKIQVNEEDQKDPLNLPFLLNRPFQNLPQHPLNLRRMEFRKCILNIKSVDSPIKQ